MRKRKLIYLLFPILSILLVNCNEENNDFVTEGKIEFRATIDGSENKSSNNLSNVSAAIVTIEDENGAKIYESNQLNLYKFNDVYITEPLSLNTGSYMLTSFYLIDSSESVRYASPLSSSEMAYLVDQPLPISFNVTKDEITTLEPEVLSTEGYTPDDFGYFNFGFNEVEIFDFLIAVCKYNTSIENFELTDAELLITSDDDTLYINLIEAITNKITIRDGYDNYNISLTKSGYKDYTISLTCDSLKEYFSNPLTVIMESISLTDGLVAYYPFDGNVNDYSGNENNATNYGARLTADRFGNLNSAYEFNGVNDYMRIDHTEDLNFDSYLNSYTLSLWVKGNSENVETSRLIVKWNDLLGTPYPFFIGAMPTDCITRIYDTENTNTGTDCGNIWDESWQHIILVVDADNGFMDSYINNIIIGSSSISYFGSTANEIDIFIGGTPIVDRYFNGYIDDIRLYNKALTEDEIQALYHEDGWDL